jgi:circadian clock protein KaiB
MKYQIKLYVTGQTPRSQQAIANLRRICEEELSGHYELVVVDVLDRPQLAEDEKILATPTVVKELPHPIRRIIGDLSDSDRVLLGLDLRPYSEEPQ